jgi:hypothetical protein
MGVCTRYPKAYIQKDVIFPGQPHLGHTFSVWSGQTPSGPIGVGETETDAWVDAYQYIINREGRCP